MSDLDFIRHRNQLLRLGLAYSATVAEKGKARDRALYDFLVGAVTALNELDPERFQACPGWLYVLGVRGGTRVAEAEAMLPTTAESVF